MYNVRIYAYGRNPITFDSLMYDVQCTWDLCTIHCKQ